MLNMRVLVNATGLPEPVAFFWSDKLPVGMAAEEAAKVFKSVKTDEMEFTLGTGNFTLKPEIPLERALMNDAIVDLMLIPKKR